MRDLSTVRQGWEEIEKAEACLASGTTPQESFRQWLQLQATFESQLRETSALFGPQRASDLAELQTRLRRFAQWQERHGNPDAVHPAPPETAARR
jgi:site-specific recombinase XerC